MGWFANMDWIDYNFLLVILLMVSIAIGDYLKDILSWIKLQWKEAAPLKKIYIVVACIIGVALIYLFATLYLQILLFISNPLAEIKIDTNFALAFLGTVTGLVALFTGFIAILRSETNENQNKIAIRKNEIAHDTNQITIKQNELDEIKSKTANRQAHTAERNSEIAEQSLITERLNKATENLGKSTDDGDPVIEVRIGALLALERIAQDSIRDHIQIMEILCAYIRHNSPLPDKEDTEENSTLNTEIKTKRKKLAGEVIDEDIQTAITIIGRRGNWEKGKEYLQKEDDLGYRIDLFQCNLCGARFSNANLINAILIGSDMSDCWFNDADLNNAALENTNLTNAWFESTILINSKLNDATTDKIHAHRGDFSKCKYIIQEQLNVMFLGNNIDVPKGLDHPQEGTDYYKDYATFNNFMDARREWMQKIYPDIIKKKNTQE